MITKEQKAEFILKFGANSKDCGKSESQIAIITARINDLTGHLLSHKKDHHSRRGLIQLVNKRRKLLDYLIRTDISRYRVVIKELGIRK